MLRGYMLGTLLLVLLGAADVRAAGCAQPHELKLIWDGAQHEGLVVFSAFQCDLPHGCAAGAVHAGTLLTRPPFSATVSRSGATLFSATLPGCAGPSCSSVNTGGCPGGADAHKTVGGLVKLTYAAPNRGTVMARARGPMERPGGGSGPVTVRLADAGGFTAETTFQKCQTTSQPARVVVVCR